MLASPAYCRIQAKIGAIDGLCLCDVALAQQQRAKRVPGWLYPAPRLVIGQAWDCQRKLT